MKQFRNDVSARTMQVCLYGDAQLIVSGLARYGAYVIQISDCDDDESLFVTWMLNTTHMLPLGAAETVATFNDADDATLFALAVARNGNYAVEIDKVPEGYRVYFEEKRA